MKHLICIKVLENQLKKIFEKFSQADNSTTRDFGGKGLGLNISKSLIEYMGGEMWVESQKGKGSSFNFKITFRVVKGQSVSENDSYSSFEGNKVLVVDDHETNLLILRKTLHAWGIEVKTAQSGQQALAFLQKSKGNIDLIILDHQMPKMDGFELSRRLKKMVKYKI